MLATSECLSSIFLSEGAKSVISHVVQYECELSTLREANKPKVIYEIKSQVTRGNFVIFWVDKHSKEPNSHASFIVLVWIRRISRDGPEFCEVWRTPCYRVLDETFTADVDCVI